MKSWAAKSATDFAWIPGLHRISDFPQRLWPSLLATSLSFPIPPVCFREPLRSVHPGASVALTGRLLGLHTKWSSAQSSVHSASRCVLLWQATACLAASSIRYALTRFLQNFLEIDLASRVCPATSTPLRMPFMPSTFCTLSQGRSICCISNAGSTRGATRWIASAPQISE